MKDFVKGYIKEKLDQLKKIVEDIDWRDKEKMLKFFKKYNFLILFGMTFSMYMVVLAIQGVVGMVQPSDDKGDFDITQSQQTTMAENDNNGQQGSGQLPTQDGDTTQSAIVGDGSLNVDDQESISHNEDNQEATLPIVGQTAGDNNTSAKPPNAGNVPQANAAFQTVDISYLDGALFIGDSRTMLLQTYAGWNNTTFYAETGTTIWKVMDEPIANVNGNKMTVDEALQKTQFNKIYIMLGINELGRGTAESFAAQYRKVISRIRELQPQAIIYLQSIMHVTQGRDDKGTYINNAEIDRRNEAIRPIADNVNIFWLNENEVTDEAGTGKLNPEYTSDGVHLKAKYISVWQNYILSHAIVR